MRKGAHFYSIGWGCPNSLSKMGAGASVDVAINSELAKVLSASDGDLAAAAEKANREIVRVVPKTGSGRFDPERGERAAVLQVVERAHLLAQHGYAVSWQQYNKPEDGGAAQRDGEDLLEDTRRLEEDFSLDEPPRCNLSEGASAADLIELAKRHGEALIKSLKGLVQDAGGAFDVGPRKNEGRIKQKAADDYGGDVARVCDVEQATGVFDSVDEMSLAITRLKRASRRGDITIRCCKDHFGHPFKTGYRDLQFNIELKGFVGELQLNLRRIVEVKAKAHMVYEVERVLKAGEGRDALRRAVDGPGLESEQFLRLTIDAGRSIDDAFGSLAVFEAISRRVRGGAGAGAAAGVRHRERVFRGTGRRARTTGPRRGRCGGTAAGRRHHGVSVRGGASPRDAAVGAASKRRRAGRSRI